MAVPVQDPVITHTGNGITTVFGYDFLLPSQSDLIVYIDDAIQGSGYAVSGIGSPSGGAVTITPAPAAGADIRFERVVSLTRTTDYQQSGDFFSNVVNPDFDRIWMALQRMNYFIGASIGSVARVLKLGDGDTDGAGAYRARNNRIQDLADPVAMQDAATKTWTLTQISQAVIDGAGTALMQLLGAASGASLLGFSQSSSYAAGTAGATLQRVASITDAPYLASTSKTAAQNGIAIRAAVNALNAAGGGWLWVPAGTFDFDYITPKDNVTLYGVGTLRQNQSAVSQSGIVKASGAGSLSNFHIKGVKFDGARVATPGYLYNAIISIDLGNGETLDNFSVEGCDMQDAQEHFIRVIASHSSARGRRIRVRKNTFQTTAAKRSLGGTSTAVSYDGVRIEQTWDYATAGNGYGTVNFTKIRITENDAESIRTLGDIKRGCAKFQIKGNFTKNMFDCHHSVDGSFHGVIAHNVCEHEASYAGPSTLTNFIEVQGEHISIESNVCDGGGLVHSGIFVSDYGRAEEGGIGHCSVSVSQSGNKIKGITGNALRVLNGVSCSTIDNEVENVGGHVATIESGTGRTDGTNPLTATGCAVSGNRSKNATLGVKMQGSNNIKGVNPDENGQDYFYIVGLSSASTAANFVNDDGYLQLNPNQWLEISGTNLKWFINHVTTAVLAGTKPDGAPQAVTINDDSAASIRQHTLDCFIPAVQNDRLYVRLSIKKNTANEFAVVVQEYTAAGAFIANTFYGITSVPTSWADYTLAHKVTNATAGQVRIGLIPAAAANNVTPTGLTDVANLRIARAAIGR